MSDDAMPIDALIAQGCCCGSGCANCPYTPTHVAGVTDLDQEWIAYHNANPGVTRDQYEASKSQTPPSSMPQAA